MNTPVNTKVPPHLVLIAVLSGGLTIFLSLFYILLSIIYFIYRTKCSVGGVETATGADFFWRMILNVYILSTNCGDEKFEIPELTKESTVFILMCVTICITVLCLVTAIILITNIQEGTRSRYLKLAIYTYICSSVASLTIDITTASHFGVDYSYVTSILKNLTAGSPLNYYTDVVRQGAFWLMTIAMKGYIAHFINCVLLILLVIYYQQYEKYLKTVQEHSIHKLGALSGFEQRNKPEATWPRPEIYNNNPSPSSRGPYLNNAFVEDDTPPRSPMRAGPLRPDYSNNSFDRSDSWHHSQDLSMPSSRPFSYLEEMKRPPVPTRPPPSPAVEPPWRNNNQWQNNQGPSLPAPDYSPTQPRRLKSALKPAYM